MAESSRRYNLRDTRKKPQGVLLKRWEVEYSKLISNETRRIPLESVKTAIRSAFEDGMFEQWRITLKCPLSGQRIKVPARYTDCTHIECFDLEAFIRMKTQKNLLVCPICQKEVEKPLTNIRVDKYIETVLSTVPNAMQVELLPDGSFTKVHEEFVVVPHVINDEEPYVQDSNVMSFNVKQEALQNDDDYITLSDGEDEPIEEIAIIDMKPISLIPLNMDIRPMITSELEQIHSGEDQEIQEALEDDHDYITIGDSEDEFMEEISIVDMKPLSLMPLNMDIQPKITSSSETEQIHFGEDQEIQDQHNAATQKAIIYENDQSCSTGSATIMQSNVKTEPEVVDTSDAEILGTVEIRKRKAPSKLARHALQISGGIVNSEGESSNLRQMKHATTDLYKTRNPDLNELRGLLKDAVQKQMEQRAVKKFKKQLEGVGATITQLQNPDKFKERITSNQAGHVINDSIKPKPVNSQTALVRPLPDVNYNWLASVLQLKIQTQATDSIAGAVAHPTKPSEIRKLIRSKMIRCKRCKNRFLEKNLYERHLRDKHQVDHLVYVIKQEEDKQQKRKEELEEKRIEEMTTGGFIPPENEIDSSNFDVKIDEIPLPGELTGSVPARFNKYGGIVYPQRVYTKKISPQCPFCDKRYADEPNLTKHIAKKHPECVEFVQCLKCYKALPSKKDLDSHMCEMIFICFECTPIRNLCTDVRLYEHRKRFHRGDKSGFKCDLCNKKFMTPRKVKRHKKMSHVFEKTYSCHFCEEVFTSSCDVVKHERIHTRTIEFKCQICKGGDFCDYKCNRFLSMEQRKRDEHEYACSVYQEKFAEYGGLKSTL